MRLVAEGKSRAEIAKALKTSVPSLRRYFADALNHKPGAKPWEPTDAERAAAVKMARYGISQREIASTLGISTTTLRKHLGDDLAKAPIEANVDVAHRLYQDAKVSGNTSAQVFWLRSRAGWNDRQSVNVNVSGEISHDHRFDLVGLVRQLSPAARAALRTVLEEIRTIAPPEESPPELDVTATAKRIG